MLAARPAGRPAGPRAARAAAAAAAGRRAAGAPAAAAAARVGSKPVGLSGWSAAPGQARAAGWGPDQPAGGCGAAERRGGGGAAGEDAGLGGRREAAGGAGAGCLRKPFVGRVLSGPRAPRPAGGAAAAAAWGFLGARSAGGPGAPAAPGRPAGARRTARAAECCRQPSVAEAARPLRRARLPMSAPSSDCPLAAALLVGRRLGAWTSPPGGRLVGRAHCAVNWDPSKTTPPWHPGGAASTLRGERRGAGALHKLGGAHRARGGARGAPKRAVRRGHGLGCRAAGGGRLALPPVRKQLVLISLRLSRTHGGRVPRERADVKNTSPPRSRLRATPVALGKWFRA